jgi:hypothetical protein
MQRAECLFRGASAGAGVATMVLAVALLLIFPASAELTDGFRTPVLAFEFAQSEADLAFLTGSSDAAVQHRRQMDHGQQLDMAFPFAYGGLIALYLMALGRQGIKSAWIGAVIAVAIIPADIRENLVMLEITSALAQGDSIGPFLPALWAATWLKWGCIAASMGFLAFGLLSRKAWYGGTLSAVASAAIVLTWLTGAHPIVAETMLLLVSVFFVFFPVHAVIAAWREFARSRKARTPPQAFKR